MEEADIYLTAADLRPELTTRLSGRSPLRNITDITAQVGQNIGPTTRSKLKV